MPNDARAVAALRRIAFLLELAQEPTYRVRAFRRAADLVSALSADELDQRIREGPLEQLPSIGAVTALAITEAQRSPQRHLSHHHAYSRARPDPPSTVPTSLSVLLSGGRTKTGWKPALQWIRGTYDAARRVWLGLKRICGGPVVYAPSNPIGGR